MPSHKVDIIVGVKDFATRSLRNIQNSVTGMSKSFSTVGTHLGAFNRNLDATINKMDRLANSMYKFNMYTSSLQRGLQNISMIGGAAVAGVAMQGTNNALDYDYKTRIMQSRMEASNNVRGKVSDYILNDLNYKVSYSPTQLADTGIILGQGGVNNVNDMKSMLKTVSYFSEAVDAIPQQAAEMVISAAKGFGISMENSGTITDKLTVALNKSLLHVEEMPHAIGELAGRANMYGQSLDSSLVALMTMRDQGMSAAQGSQDLLHALRQASRIGNDEVLFKRTKGYFDSLGVTNGIFNPETRQLKEFPELIADMEKAMINQGYVNPRYNVKNEEDFKTFLANNGGTAPKDFWDSEKAMPLITRVFGAAGMAPILMGLQSQYQEVDPETGNKIGEKYYGSEALKQMYKDVNGSAGAVDNTHEIIAQSGKFQLEVLGGAWQAAQIRLLDGIVPLIKTGAEQLTKFITPSNGSDRKLNGQQEPGAEIPQSGLDTFRVALKDTVNKFNEEGNTGMATTVDTVGNGILNGVQIGSTMKPVMEQIGKSFNENLVKGDWGGSLIEFPWHIVKNGIAFITDIVAANEEFDAMVKNLPTDLQDPAKLVETLVKGGIALMVTGAVIKVIELGVRGVSLAMKGTKIATSLTEAIIGMFTGNKGGKGGALSEIFGKNMTVKANIVNVYGPTGTVGGGPGGHRTPGGAPPIVAGGSNAAAIFKSIGGWTAVIAAVAATGWILNNPEKTTEAVKNNPVQEQVEKMGPETDRKIKEMHEIIKDPSKYTGPRDTEIVAESSFWKPKFVESPKPMNDVAAINAETKANIEAKNEKTWTAIQDMFAEIKNFFGGNKKEEPKGGPMSPYEEIEAIKSYTAEQAKSATIEGTYIINDAIIAGFNSANEKLQNVNLQNAVSVVVQPPQVRVSGNIANYATVSSEGSSSFTKRESQNGTAWDRMQQIQQRRLGW